MTWVMTYDSMYTDHENIFARCWQEKPDFHDLKTYFTKMNVDIDDDLISFLEDDGWVVTVHRQYQIFEDCH